MTTNDLTAQRAAGRDRYRQQLAGIRQDPRLSADGKRAEIADAWLRFSAQDSDLAQRDEEQRTTEIRQLEQRIYSPVGSTVSTAERASRQASYRDALDRAEALTEDSAGGQAMTRALRTGDDDLARAIVSVAIDRGWMNVVNQYIATTPQLADDLERLWHLRRERDDLAFIVQRELRFREDRPPELAAFRDDQIQSVADGSLTAEQAFGAPLQQ